MQVLTLTEEKITSVVKNRKLKVTIVGLGKMGLPLATVFTNSGFMVSGLDISINLVNQLNQGQSDLFNEPYTNSRLKEAVENKLFKAYTDIREAVHDSTYIIIIIPVIIDDQGQADLRSLLETYSNLIEHAPPGVIFIQESTLPPGTTSGLIKDKLEENGKKSGIDFGLAFAPERTFSGRVIDDIELNYPKIIGGDTTNAANAVRILYNEVCKKGVIQLSSAIAAEAVKTFKGAYRDANIAIANQLAILADLYKIDILEVINAANTEPFSHIHQPGIGVGGHCIPVYPHFLISEGKRRGYDADIFDRSRKTNDGMVNYAISAVEKSIENWNISILVMGLAYRGGVKEQRYSPCLRLVPALRSKGASVIITDPLFSDIEIDEIFGSNSGENWDIGIVDNYDVIFIVTDHQEFKNIESHIDAKIVFDGRYVLDREKSERFVLLQPGRLNINN